MLKTCTVLFHLMAVTFGLVIAGDGDPKGPEWGDRLFAALEESVK